MKKRKNYFSAFSQKEVNNMYIKKLDIESLGSIKGLSHENLIPGVNAIIGKNGTGKSTTRSALNFVLFGIPAHNDNTYHIAPSYFSDKNQIRSISALLSDGVNTVKVTRTSSNKKASDDVICEPTTKKDLFTSYLEHVSLDDFKNVWSMSELDISSIDPSESTAIEHFLASQYGIKAAPHTVKENLSIQNKNQASTAKNTNSLGTKKKELVELLNTVRELQQTSHETFEASQELETAIQAEEKCTTLRIEKTRRYNQLAELKKTEQSLRNNLDEAVSKRDDLNKQLNTINATRPEKPNEELLSQQFRLKSLPKDLENYRDRKTRLDELKTDQHLSEHELSSYPNIAFSHTSADWAFAQNRSQEISQSIAETKFKYESDNLDVEQKQALNEHLANEEKTVRTFGFGAVALPVVTALISLIVAVVLLFTSAPSYFAGISALAGLAIIAIEFMTIIMKGKKSVKPSPETRHAYTELESLKARRDASKIAWQKSEDAWVAFVAQYFPGNEEMPRDELLRAIQRAPEVLILEKHIEENRLKISESMQFLKSITDTFVSAYAKCFPGEPAPEDYALLVSRCGERIDSELKLKASFDTYLSRKNELERQISELAAAIKKLQSQLTDLADQLSCSESEVQDYLSQHMNEIEHEIKLLNEQIAQYNESIGHNRALIDTCFDQDELNKAQAALQRCRSEVYAKAHEALVTNIAEKLLNDALEYFDKHSAPPIIEESNKIFSRITQGAFTHIIFPQERPASEEKVLSVIDKNRNEFTPDTLSLGTMRQLYLAIRFGVIQAQSKKKINVPIVLDEILASFDEERRDAAIKEINELAKEHQVFYFSARNDVIEKPEACSWNVIKLDQE